MTSFLSYIAITSIAAACQLIIRAPLWAIILLVASILASAAIRLWVALTGGIFA